jgi:hypothetical protein
MRMFRAVLTRRPTVLVSDRCSEKPVPRSAFLPSLLAIVVALALVSSADAAKRPKYGVFGKINGKKFKAKSNGETEDVCVTGTYLAAGGLSLTAGECRGKRFDVPRKKFALVMLRCATADPPRTPPFEAACSVAAYSEARVKGDQALDQKVWASRVTTVPDHTGALILQSAIQIRVESFDGTYVRGAFFGAFDLPQSPGLETAPVDDEVQFFFPVKAVQ